jgi:histidinol dehydrogenase
VKRFDHPQPESWSDLLARANETVSFGHVKPIVESVRKRGDDALFELTARFDGVRLDALSVPVGAAATLAESLPTRLTSAIELASQNIRAFHEKQAESGVEAEPLPGLRCWRRSVPIDHVGFYIPGGRAPLFSTMLMLGIPARIAGCNRITVCTPPQPDGSVHPAILYAAASLDVDHVFTVGGAQAIAAMAFGTETVPAVDKIFGPGNQWVTLAKRLVEQQGVAIDLPAGPTELAAIVDSSCKPDFVAADLLAQAEHGPDSHLVLISTDAASVDRIEDELQKQIQHLDRRDTIQTVLDSALAVVLANKEDALAFSDVFAPEHLLIATEDALALAERVRNAGSVFVGNYAAPAAGDYITGTNHTLPTSGFARTASGVSLDSFVRKITFQSVTPSAFERIGPPLATMASAEGLTGHAASAEIRLAKHKPTRP